MYLVKFFILLVLYQLIVLRKQPPGQRKLLMTLPTYAGLHYRRTILYRKGKNKLYSAAFISS
jgi:hypothetical protein